MPDSSGSRMTWGDVGRTLPAWAGFDLGQQPPDLPPFLRVHRQRVDDLGQLVTSVIPAAE
jgi:hypothetical protein